MVVSRPACYTFVLTNGTATLSWCAVAGLNYRVQWNALLQDTAGWTDVPGTVAATGALAVKSFAIAAGSQRFYRVLVVP